MSIYILHLAARITYIVEVIFILDEYRYIQIKVSMMKLIYLVLHISQFSS